MVFIYTTCKEMEEAENLSKLIINKKLAVIVDFWPTKASYQWDGATIITEHIMIMISTFEKKLEDLSALIAENHKYSTPMIAGVDVRRINYDYKEWMTRKIA
jgi:periplasmic divalent cation tolerance protein